MLPVSPENLISQHTSKTPILTALALGRYSVLRQIAAADLEFAGCQLLSY